jgi:hypothetical protein
MQIMYLIYSKNHKKFNKSHIQVMYMYILWLEKKSNLKNILIYLFQTNVSSF